jgi:hypothetical protein
MLGTKGHLRGFQELQELKDGNNFLLALASTISRYFSAGDFLLLMLLGLIFPCICSVL